MTTNNKWMHTCKAEQRNERMNASNIHATLNKETKEWMHPKQMNEQCMLHARRNECWTKYCFHNVIWSVNVTLPFLRTLDKSSPCLFDQQLYAQKLQKEDVFWCCNLNQKNNAGIKRQLIKFSDLQSIPFVIFCSIHIQNGGFLNPSFTNTVHQILGVHLSTNCTVSSTNSVLDDYQISRQSVRLFWKYHEMKKTFNPRNLIKPISGK